VPLTACNAHFNVDDTKNFEPEQSNLTFSPLLMIGVVEESLVIFKILLFGI
jgi:hypothetical protein